MRFLILIAFFALIAIVVAAKTGAQHGGQHGGVKLDVGGQGALPLNGTHLSLNSTEPSATETNSTVASATAT